jgi:hypothetical protein
VSVESGLLVLCLSHFVNGFLTATVTCNGSPMTLDKNLASTFGPNYVQESIYSLPVSAGTVTLTISYAGTAEFAAQWANITGLVNNAADQSASSNALSAASLTVGTTGTTTGPSEAAICGVATTNGGAVSYTWVSPFVSAGEDESGSTAAAEVLTTIGTVSATVDFTGTEPALCVGCLVTYS